MPGRIEDYALIGDGQGAALVGRDGSIDWLCWPRFDSDACFAALLGRPEHGRWLLTPADPTARVTRRYRTDTLILETRFETAEGAVTVVDFMPPQAVGSDLIRLVIGERGRVAMRCELVLRFGYGATTPWVSRLEDGGIRAIAGPEMVVLRTPVALKGEDMRTVGRFAVSAGETTPFVLSWSPSHLPAPAPVNPRAMLADTEAFWKKWIAHGVVKGRYARHIKRSLITLKALIYMPTGGVVAAPTASLPEQFGGIRNWDYRYCWIRDATLTLLALMDAGYFEEAQGWRDWLLRAVAGSPSEMHIMYGIAGERRLTEWEVEWLPGYEGAAPVRIGNAAQQQFQLDVYGELMDAFHQARRGGLGGSESIWALQRALVDHVAEVWDEPDEGIWEVRSGRKHFTFSKVMAWVVMDRAIKTAEAFGVEGPIEKWRTLRQRIRDDVCTKGFDSARGHFIRAYDDPTLDASLLLLAELGFLKPDDPTFRATVEAIERELMVDGFVLRYDTGLADDGLPPGEGAFLACSFWLVNAYVMLGRRDDAVALFERLVGLCNDVGLLAEEYEPRLRRHAGNFPQAFSHVGLINAAFNLTRSEKPAEQRAERAAAAD